MQLVVVGVTMSCQFDVKFFIACHCSPSNVLSFFSFFSPCFMTGMGSEAGQAFPSGPGVIVWVISGCLILLLVTAVVLVMLWKYHRRCRVPDRQQQHQPPVSVSLSTLAVPKRDSISSDNDGSDRSEVVFPLRPSESMICRHYERVSSDYGPPVYIVQEIMPQSPTNVYYKV